MNSYDQLLFYLLENKGDHEFIKVENILSLNNDVLHSILKTLAKDGLLLYQGGYNTSITRVGFGDGRGNFTPIDGGKDYYVPYSAKITFKGINYLEEKMPKPKNSIKITAGDSASINLNVGSPHSTINANKQATTDIINEIKAVLLKDQTLAPSEKVEALEVFEQLGNEVKNGYSITKTVERAISFGANISSIASYMTSLWPMLKP